MSPGSGSEFVEVAISKRLLWVGNDYYPLQNITNVHTPEKTQEYLPHQKKPILIPIGTLVIFFIGDIVLVIIIAFRMVYLSKVSCGQCSNLSTAAENHIESIMMTVFFAVLAVGVFVSIVLFLTLGKNPKTFYMTHYTLAIETAGTWKAVLLSRDAAEVFRLARNLKDAIYNNQHLEYSASIHIGDNINQYGTGNIGKTS